MTIDGSGAGDSGVEAGAGDSDAIRATGSSATSVAASETGGRLTVSLAWWCETVGRFAGTAAFDCSMSDTNRMRR